MDKHTPLGRTANTPENPWDDLDATLVPLNEGKGLDLTLASKKDSFVTKEEAIKENDEGSAGPSSAITPPGGNPMISMNGYVAQEDKMQYSKEGSDSYSGAAVYSKIIKGGSNTENI